ncbi:MAG TPA: hypothetical protein VHU86_04020 [Solirubrobacterales bacterium]|nr:hypothetical protein [Solirubrobacterales bacterium]
MSTPERRPIYAAPGPVGMPPKPQRRRPRHRRRDLVLGILVGIVLGLGIVAAFVFLGSEGTVDAPRISGVDSGKPGVSPEPVSPVPAPKPAPAPTPTPHPIPTVHVIGGAPPTTSGPAQLHFKRGEEIRFRVRSDAPVGIAIPGLGIEETVESGQVVSFKARRVGQFPVIVAGGDISLASILVAR